MGSAGRKRSTIVLLSPEWKFGYLLFPLLCYKSDSTSNLHLLEAFSINTVLMGFDPYSLISFNVHNLQAQINIACKYILPIINK